MMNGPHRSPGPLGPGPIMSPGPPFPISDRPPSHTGPLPMADDRPPSLTGHPSRSLSDIPRYVEISDRLLHVDASFL